MTYVAEVAGLPEGGPATLEDTKVLLRIDDDTDDIAIGLAVNAVNAVVRRMSCAQAAVDHPDWSGAANVLHGAAMLAARLFKRRATLEGVQTFGQDGALYVQRNDPDIAMLLGLGSYSGLAVG